MAIQARTINLNIQPNFAITPRVNVSQYDNGVPIEFILMDGLLEASLPSGATAKVQGTRPSGVGFSETCTIDDNILTLDSTTSMTGEAGQIPAEVVIEYSGDVIGTANFFLNVERSPHPDGTIDSDIIEQAGLVERVETLEGDVDQNTGDIADLKADIGDLEDLETEDKSSLVNAINEARGSGGSGLTEDVKAALLACFRHIAFLDDDADYYGDLEDALYPPANLVSISAVYSGGDVYNTATLESLKQNLAVTAHFDNSTTQTVTSYVLSGTIATGTQTITVTYGGKTTTFTITVVDWVTSINAVYSGGSVYNTATLDDLKANLVVTANYADSTSETVSDYTLSGELEIGTNTITVTYAGKTATFTVTVTDPTYVDYTANALSGATWGEGQTYNESTGVLESNASCYYTDKFNAQEISYNISSSDTNCSLLKIFIWDSNNSYVGFVTTGSRTIPRLQLKSGYKYALVATYSSGTFDSSLVTMQIVDNRNTAVSQFEISLADNVENITKVGSNPIYELLITDILSALGITITSSSLNTAINRMSVFGYFSTANLTTLREFYGGKIFYSNGVRIQIKIPSATTLADAKTYVVDNDISIKFNY